MACKKKLLVVLQCAYSNSERGAVALRNNSFWKYRLWLSHTGKRLKEMLPDNVDFDLEVINSTDTIGLHSGALFPPNATHIQLSINSFEPDVILACGNVAQKGLDELGIEYIKAPHPAWRMLSKRNTEKIKNTLEEALSDYLTDTPSD